MERDLKRFLLGITCWLGLITFIGYCFEKAGFDITSVNEDFLFIFFMGSFVINLVILAFSD